MKDRELLYLGSETDSAVVPFEITSRLPDPIDFYREIGQDAILFPSLNSEGTTWYDYFSDEIVTAE